MLGIQQITKEISKKNKLNQEQIKTVLENFLEVAKKQITAGENIAFKGYFSLKRLSSQPKGNKNCDDHQRELDKFKANNKGKGVQFYAKSIPFRSLVTKTRNCNKCNAKKQGLIKNSKPTNRISFKVSKGFWVKGKR